MAKYNVVLEEDNRKEIENEEIKEQVTRQIDIILEEKLEVKEDNFLEEERNEKKQDNFLIMNLSTKSRQ